MIGNDIVVFENAKTQKSRLDRKFQKILHPNERYLKNKHFTHQDYCIIWSIKETAYKAIQRKLQLPMKLNPHEIQLLTYVRNNNRVKSIVYYMGIRFEVNGWLTKEFIYTYSGENLLHHFNLSFIQYLVPFNHIIKAELFPYQIQKNSLGIPFAINETSVFPISKTHDKNWIAYCWES